MSSLYTRARNEGLRSVGSRLARFGWLPASQAIVFLISTGTFAVFARVLGPVPYARFAALLFCYTVVSLAVDLSPQSWILVKGYSPNALHVARRITAVNSLVGVIVLSLALAAISSSLPGGQLSVVEWSSLALAIVAQNVLQIPRAKLVVHRHYRGLGVSEILGATVGAMTAATVVFASGSGTALSLQLGVGTLVRLGVFILMARKMLALTADPETAWTVRHGLTYGLSVVPLNLAAYCGRALDSGILPYLVTAASAAAYSRSYQVVVTPVTQLQLAFGLVIFERLAKRFRETGVFPDGDRLWKMLWFGGSAVAIVVSLFSGLIAAVLFGPRWSGVQTLVTVMAACLPGLGITLFGSWSTQLSNSRTRSLGHLAVVLVTPLAVITTAALGTFEEATHALFIGGGLVQPMLLTLLHRRAAQGRLAAKGAMILFTWLVLLSLLVLM